MKVEGLTQSDAAEVMGLSKQRVSQLINAQEMALKTAGAVGDSRELVDD